jgi:hypothetical protein
MVAEEHGEEGVKGCEDGQSKMAGSSGGKRSAREPAMAVARIASTSEARASGEGRERARVLYIKTVASVEGVRHMVEEVASGVLVRRPRDISSSTWHVLEWARWDTVLGQFGSKLDFGPKTKVAHLGMLFKFH